MILVTGGIGSGKRQWVCNHLGYTPEDLGSDPSTACPVLYDVQDRALEIDAESLLDREVIICNEVGAGLVPTDACERRLRESAGRLGCDLAAAASCVVRVCFGIGVFIKGSLDLAYADLGHMRIELYRHGKTAGNLRKAYVGSTDEDLCEDGRRELHAIDASEKLVYTSSLKRSRQSASILFPNAEQISLPELNEMDFGAFEGKNFEDLKDDARYRDWVDGGCKAACPGGEERASFQRRCCAAFAKIADDALENGEGRLRLVVHGGTIMSILGNFASPSRDYFEWHTRPGQCWTASTDEKHWSKGQCIVVGRPSGSGQP